MKEGIRSQECLGVEGNSGLGVGGSVVGIGEVDVQDSHVNQCIVCTAFRVLIPDCRTTGSVLMVLSCR